MYSLCLLTERGRRGRVRHDVFFWQCGSCCYMCLCRISLKQDKILAALYGTKAKGLSKALFGSAMPRWPGQQSPPSRKRPNMRGPNNRRLLPSEFPSTPSAFRYRPTSFARAVFGVCIAGTQCLPVHSRHIASCPIRSVFKHVLRFWLKI